MASSKENTEDTDTTSEAESSLSDHKPVPDTPPSELLTRTLPPVKNYDEIAPDDDDCTVRNGDLVVVHVGTDAVEWYGFLVLDTYGRNTIVGLALPAFQYGRRDLDDWIDWSKTHLNKDHITVYSEIVPVAESDTE
jgi:hypothetical protein